MVTRPAPPRLAASAASRAAPVIVAPPTTVTWPREYLWDCDPGTGSRHSSGRLAKHDGTTCFSTAPGSPISASTSLAAQFPARQQKVPRLQPEERHGQRGLRRKATHRAGRAIEPARHIHSNHTPRRAQRIGDDAIHVARQAGAEHGVDHQLRARRLRRRERCGRTTPVRAASAASDPARGGASAASATGQPSCANSRAATYPSPPLLPGPASTSVRHGRNRCWMARATARPAFAISVGPGTPSAGEAASARAISSGVSSSDRPASERSQSGSNVTR